MEKNRLRTGSIALLFLVIILALSVFSVLSSVTALRGLKASERYAEHISEVYETESMGQIWLMEVENFLKGEGTLNKGSVSEDGTIKAEIHNGNTVLKAELRIEGEGYRITEWSIKTEWEDKFLNLL
ncbi:MAG: hypothetical protein MJ171_05810 [Clostridia bacterium]|nr:hypothetical protein [Clostridia bacterium]